jgi:hypothetical protein
MKNKIKLLTVFLAAIAMAFQVSAQSSDLVRLMEDLEGEEGTTSVLVTKKMFELFTKTTDIEMEGQSMNEVIGGLEELLLIEIGGWEPAAKDLKEKVNGIIKRDKFETLMKVSEDNEEVGIFIMEDGDVIRHLFMFIEDADDAYQLISIKGNIDLEKISRLSGTLNIEGLKHLDDE